MPAARRMNRPAAGSAGRGHRPSQQRPAARALGPLIVCAGLWGCGTYNPPVIGDHPAQAYRTDLRACRTTAHHQVYLRNAATPGRWLISPITGPPAVRRAIRACLRAKGYTPAPG
jgi:hypothetical protein